MKNLLILMIILSGLVLSSCSGSDFKGIPFIPLESNGAVPIIIQDQFTPIVDLRLTYDLQNITLLNNISIDVQRINITSALLPTTDMTLELKQNESFYQSEILNVTSLGGNNYQIYVQDPLDTVYTTGGVYKLSNDNWAIDGSVTPYIFKITPGALSDTVEWDITRILLACLGEGTTGPDQTPDLSSFFTMDPLTKGIVFRHLDGETKNIFGATNNFHLALEAYDVTLYPASKFGLFATTVRRTFNGADKNGVVIRLRAKDNDEFQLIIQDDLTAMSECHATVQGHLTTM